MQTAQTSTKQQFTAADASSTAGKTTPDTVVGGTDGVWMESGWSGPSKMPFSRENNSVEKTHGENLLETAPHVAVPCGVHARSRLFVGPGCSYTGGGLTFRILCGSGSTMARYIVSVAGIVPRTAVKKKKASKAS